MTSQSFHLASVRTLLLEGFTEPELRRLCYDVPDFRPVYNELAQKTGQAEIVDRLLEHAEKRMQIPALLALAEQENPKRYKLHGPYYVDDEASHLRKTVSDLAKRLAELMSPAKLTKEQQYELAWHWRELGGKAKLANFDLSGMNLNAADLAGADLHGAYLEGTQLRLASLERADLRAVNLTRANLYGAIIIQADLSGAILNSADMTRAMLNQANLRSAVLCGTNLDNANLIGANFSGTDLRGANLGGANLTDATVTTEQLAQVSSLEGTTLPDGTKHIKARRYQDQVASKLEPEDVVERRQSGVSPVFAEVQRVIAKELGIEAGRVTTDSRLREDLGADSLDLVELVMAFEDEFGGEIPDEEANRIGTVGDVVQYLEKRLQDD